MIFHIATFVCFHAFFVYADICHAYLLIIISPLFADADYFDGCWLFIWYYSMIIAADLLMMLLLYLLIYCLPDDAFTLLLVLCRLLMLPPCRWYAAAMLMLMLILPFADACAWCFITPLRFSFSFSLRHYFLSLLSSFSFHYAFFIFFSIRFSSLLRRFLFRHFRCHCHFFAHFHFFLSCRHFITPFSFQYWLSDIISRWYWH